MKSTGVIIVLEGLDGAGKSTQIKLLLEHFRARKLTCNSIHFPIYSGFYGELISSFLKGDFGSASCVDPYFASFIYASNRKEHLSTIMASTRNHDITLLDRYVLSNIAFQCAKVTPLRDKLILSDFIYHMEYNTYDLPRAELSIFLSTPLAHVTKTLSIQRDGPERNYLNGRSDIHESDLELQASVHREYVRLTSDDSGAVLVDCAVGDDLMPASDISKSILSLLISRNII